MILSVSRRTDIPSFYLDWFINRLEARYVLVRNPMNFHQVSHIDLSPEWVECIVFWTKNPAPMLSSLDRLERYPYYIQFTLNPYGSDLEHALPPKEKLLDTFKRLSDALGPRRMVWRYSPVILNGTYTEQRHTNVFGHFARELEGYTLRCNLSFVDIYHKIERRMAALGIAEVPAEQKVVLAKTFKDISTAHGIDLRACGDIDLAQCGIPGSKCIDDALISEITGKSFHMRKDPGQPAHCMCVPSIDVGAYNTCLNGCQYCYANQASDVSTLRKSGRYDPASPLLCGSLGPDDVVKERKVSLAADRQIGMFDPLV